MTDAQARPHSDRTARLAMRTRTFAASSMTECLQMAKQEMGLDAMIVSKRTFRKGALFGRWGGRPMVEVTFGTYKAPDASLPTGGRLGSPASSPLVSSAPGPDMQQLEARMASLADSVQTLIETGGSAGKNGASSFVSAPVEAKGMSAFASPPPAAPSLNAPPEPTQKTVLGRRTLRRAPEPDPVPQERYPALMRQLLDAEVAPLSPASLSRPCRMVWNPGMPPPICGR